MRKYWVAGFVVALLAGCASTAPVQAYRAPGQAEAWHVSGRLDELSETLTITINGRDAVSGKLSLWDGSGTVVGNYEGRTVSANCHAQRRGRMCSVLIGSEVAANLTF
jgi:hypothetical protein